MPLAPMGAGAAPPAASAVPMALIKEAVQAAMQHEADKQAEARKSDGHDDEDKDGKPDSDEALDDDKDGDGKPDASGEEKAEVVEEDERATAAGGVDGGRAPVHVEMDVDAEQLLTPITVTLDRKNPIGSPPASAT